MPQSAPPLGPPQPYRPMSKPARPPAVNSVNFVTATCRGDSSGEIGGFFSNAPSTPRGSPGPAQSHLDYLMNTRYAFSALALTLALVLPIFADPDPSVAPALPMPSTPAPSK